MRISDWSSDVCSSDLHDLAGLVAGHRGAERIVALEGEGDGGAGGRIGGERRADRHIGELVAGGGRAWCADGVDGGIAGDRSEEHTSELQSLMRISYAVFCLKKKNTTIIIRQSQQASQTRM